MYNDHFGFNEAPFSISPDPRFLYMSDRHRDALAHLIYGAGENGGFVLLTGQVGTGKTTLIRSLIEQNLENIDIAMCLHSGLSTIDFVASICDELNVSYPDNPTSLKPLVDALNQHLLTAHADGRQTVLIIDEGQNLSREVLEQIRLLTNLETNNRKLLRIILVGQEELQDSINRKDLRQLSQRITTRYHLTALNAKEVKEYITHRLKKAKGNPSIFSAQAIKKVYQLTGGVPRLINVLCDRALLTAYNEDVYRVSAKHINDAAAETLPNYQTKPRTGHHWGYPIAGLIAIAGIGYAGYQHIDRPALLNYLSASDTPPSEPLSNKKTIENKIDKPVAQSNPQAKLPTEASTHTKKTIATNNDVSRETSLSKTEKINPNKPIQHSLANNTAPQKAQPTPVNVFDYTTNQTLGIIDLLSLWKLDSNIPANQTVCEFVKTQQMVCQQSLGGYPLLLEINRPALLELKKPAQQTTWLPIAKIGKDSMQCTKQAKIANCATNDILRYWTGNFITLLKAPKVSLQIRPGFEGEQTRWLRQRIAIAEKKDYTKIDTSLVYDKALMERVKRFQKRHLMDVDGIVGNNTLLYLFNVVIDKNTPVLTTKP